MLLIMLHSKWELLSLPHPEDKERQGVVIGGASLWMIDGKPEAEQNAAWEFMKYLTNT